MRSIDLKFQKMVVEIPPQVKNEVDLSFAIADEIALLMKERGLSKKQFAESLGKRPSEITKWLSGQHNFTIRTLSLLSAFFGKPLVVIPSQKESIPQCDMPSQNNDM